jgi:isopentenyl phosphate kinase
VLVKLGGSLITDKTKPFVARADHIERMTRQLGEARSKYPDIDFVVGTGAGSFGHFTANEYDLRNGAHSDWQYYGMGVTHNAVARLSLLVAQALESQKLPAFVTSPASFILCRAGELVEAHIEPIKNLLLLGSIPLVHGDTITDNERGATILSTEKVLQACLERLRSSYRKITVVYFFDSKGLLDEKLHVIPHLTTAMPVMVHTELSHDVSGGIVSKVASARKAAQLADRVYLADGRADRVLQQVITGAVVGTQVMAV